LLATVTDMNLTEASAVNDAGAVRRLLDGGASVNFADTKSGETALMAAAQAGATDAAKVLLERGAAVHRTARHGKNALHFAVEEGNVAAVELLLDHKADPDASLVGKDDKGNTMPDKWRESEFPLILAIRGGHIPVVETLLRREAGIDTPARKNTIASAFAMAAGRDGAGDTPPLKRADTIRLLDLLIGAGLSLRDDPVAVCAAQSATPELLKTLLDRGAPPDSWFVGKTDEEEHSALMATIQRVRLARDAQQEIGNLDGSLDDYVRSERDGKACFRLLLRRGARVDATTKVGTTAFTEAVVSHCFDMADELLRRGANLNAPDTKGRTALHRAVSENDYADESTLKYLLKHGANRSLRDKNGDTALMVARKNKHAKATALLTGRD
ncbi:MAG: ankyrin repeat domain-containing protein, partial [Akkermansiaceae bacterium]|nr:ankyrin repeat domain-containing protein [Armatimonadota bacterium]